MFFNTAKANIKGGTKFPQINGIITFKDVKDGVILTAKINGLPQAFIFMNGTSCTGNANDEFANAKAHYNPQNCLHPYHAGDLPPLIENNGYSYMSVFLNKFKVKDVIGKVIIIHDMPDDFTTQPSGNPGTKIACGEIKKSF